MSTIAPQAGAAKLSVALRLVMALLVLSVSINYIDRGNLSIAAPLLRDELKISATQLGILLSAFFWTYSLCHILSGWLLDRFNVNWVLAIGFFLWSLATAATGLVHGFAMLLVCRFILGMGESVAYPSYAKIFASHYTEHHRGLANALVDSGAKIGPALGTLAGGLLMARFGWRPFFIVLGLGSLIWIPLWLKWMPRGTHRADLHRDEVPGMGEILRLSSAWATFVGLFCANYFWYFLLTWLPFYLVRERHFSMDKMATLGALAYCVSGGATALAGWVSFRWILAGGTPNRVRKTCTGLGLAFATCILLVTVVPNTIGSMALLMVACASYGVYASSHWAITQTIAGPLAAGRWAGLQNCVGNLAGVAAPTITGFVVDRTGHFFWAFAVAGVVSLCGSAVYLFWLGPVEPMVWRAKRRGPAVAAVR